MKKFLIAVGCGLGVIIGALLIWHVVVPVLGFFAEGFKSILAGLLA